jgi:hypothetical protein
MLKATNLVNDLEVRAEEALRALLSQVPPIRVEKIEHSGANDDGVDLRARLNVGGRPHVLLCEVKGNGQPRFVRMASLQLRHAIAHTESGATPLLIAPFLSEDAQKICRAQGIGFLDFEGNARLAFDGVFVERMMESKPVAAKRALRSLFKPKSAQVLRTLLRDPQREWRLSALASAAHVSIGHVSNVRAALVDREWVRIHSAGMSLTDPDALLDAWRDAYEPPKGERFTLYTTLHGPSFDAAVRPVLGVAEGGAKIILASFSAAQWLAPYARIGTHFFYADDAGLDVLRQTIALSSAAKGENVIVTRLNDSGLFLDAITVPPGIACTSVIQTYLDLSAGGDRGREAADHLRREKLRCTQ